MPQVGFEHTIPVFEGAKTVHALRSGSTVMGSLEDLNMIALLCIVAWAANLACWGYLRVLCHPGSYASGNITSWSGHVF
jgi:hypothetical protein